MGFYQDIAAITFGLLALALFAMGGFIGLKAAFLQIAQQSTPPNPPTLRHLQQTADSLGLFAIQQEIFQSLYGTHFSECWDLHTMELRKLTNGPVDTLSIHFKRRKDA